MKEFSRHWIKSKKIRKQRKYRANAPLHIKQKFMGCHLSKELRQKYGRRSIGLRKGDKVTVMRGQFKGKTGKVERVDIKNTKAFVNGIDFVKKEGTKVFCPLHPSNLMITELNTDDKKRIGSIKQSSKQEKEKK